MILKAFKYRLNPTKEQSVLIDKHIGSCRFLYNLALETKQIAYAGNQINLSCFDLIKQWTSSNLFNRTVKRTANHYEHYVTNYVVKDEHIERYCILKTTLKVLWAYVNSEFSDHTTVCV